MSSVHGMSRRSAKWFHRLTAGTAGATQSTTVNASNLSPTGNDWPGEIASPSIDHDQDVVIAAAQDRQRGAPDSFRIRIDSRVTLPPDDFLNEELSCFPLGDK